MTSDQDQDREPYMVRSWGTSTWHIPDAGGQALCGAAVNRDMMQVLFLPAVIAPSDDVCETCRALKRGAE